MDGKAGLSMANAGQRRENGHGSFAIFKQKNPFQPSPRTCGHSFLR